MFADDKVAKLYDRTFGSGARSVAILATDEKVAVHSLASQLTGKKTSLDGDYVLVEIVEHEIEPQASHRNDHSSAIPCFEAASCEMPLTALFSGKLQRYSQFVVLIPFSGKTERLASRLETLSEFDGVVLAASDEETTRRKLPDQLKMLKDHNIMIAGLMMEDTVAKEATSATKKGFLSGMIASGFGLTAMGRRRKPA